VRFSLTNKKQLYAIGKVRISYIGNFGPPPAFENKGRRNLIFPPLKGFSGV
jgi:hypothetical protein